MPQFLYRLTPVRAEMPFDPLPEEAEVVGRHFVYLQDGVSRGIVKLAGRTLEGEVFGLCVYEMASLEEANEFMVNDPAVKEGVMRATLHPFAIALMSS